MKRIEEGQPFVGTVRFEGTSVTGEWVRRDDFLYLRIDPNARQDTSIAATIRMDPDNEHILAIPLARVELVVLSE